MCLSGDYRVTWGPRISTRMDKQERSVRERQGPNPSLGTCSLSLTRSLPVVLLPSPPVESLPSILCHLPGPPAQIISHRPPVEECESHFWSPVLCFLLTLTEHLLCAGQEFP